MKEKEGVTDSRKPKHESEVIAVRYQAYLLGRVGNRSDLGPEVSLDELAAFVLGRRHNAMDHPVDPAEEVHDKVSGLVSLPK